MVLRNTLFAFVGLVALSNTPAWAGNRIHCDQSGYRCYPVQRASDRPWYSRYDDDDDYDRGRHMVCDPDGDRCYLSRSWHWNYRQYYRLQGYRWDH
jgi:hypothetical protein